MYKNIHYYVKNNQKKRLIKCLVIVIMKYYKPLAIAMEWNTGQLLKIMR